MKFIECELFFCIVLTLSSSLSLYLFWEFIGESNKPIYSVDARNISNLKHFNYYSRKGQSSGTSSQQADLASRISLTPDFSLCLERLSIEDSGLYRCRVSICVFSLWEILLQEITLSWNLSLSQNQWSFLVWKFLIKRENLSFNLRIPWIEHTSLNLYCQISNAFSSLKFRPWIGFSEFQR